jgi:hypothetical protein
VYRVIFSPSESTDKTDDKYGFSEVLTLLLLEPESLLVDLELEQESDELSELKRVLEML